MNKEELQDAIEKLNLELLNLEVEDPVAREKIETLQRRLRNPKLLEEISEEPASLEEMVSDSITYFEASHPKLTSVLNQISHLLSSIGI